MAVRDNEVINLNTDEEVKKVLDLLGLTGDTGGSATAGTIMAKNNFAINLLNQLIQRTNAGVAGVTAQTKAFTEIVSKGSVTGKTTITGSGILTMMSTSLVISIKVDGKQGVRLPDTGSGVVSVSFYFEEKVEIVPASGVYYYYLVQT